MWSTVYEKSVLENWRNHLKFCLNFKILTFKSSIFLTFQTQIIDKFMKSMQILFSAHFAVILFVAFLILNFDSVKILS